MSKDEVEELIDDAEEVARKITTDSKILWKRVSHKSHKRGVGSIYTSVTLYLK